MSVPRYGEGGVFPAEYLRTARGLSRRAAFWRWVRGRRDYWVADGGGWCAGNLSFRRALEYAEGRASFGRHGAVVVVRVDRRGVCHVVVSW